MVDNLYKMIIAQSHIAYSYHKIILNEEGTPFDYEFLEVNKKFEELIGFPASRIIKKRAAELLPLPRADEFDWIAAFGEVAITGESRMFEEYFPPLKRYFRMHVQSPQKYYFAVCYSDITEEKTHLSELEKLRSYSEELLQMCACNIDYQRILNNVMKISRAQYGILLLFDESKNRFEFTVLSGDKEKMQNASRIIGFEQIGKAWNHKIVQSDIVWDRVQIHIRELHQLTGDLIPQNLIKQIEEYLDIDDLIVMRILSEGKILGDIALLMQKGVQLQNLNLIEIYSRQIGILLKRNKAEEQLLQNKRVLFESQKSAHIGSYIWDIKEGTFACSHELEEIFGIDENYSHTFEGWAKLLHPESGKVIEKIHRDIDAGKDMIEYTYKFIRVNDGEVRWASETGRTEKNETGKPVRVIGTVLDITNQKRTEDKLIASEQRLKAVIANISDVILILDENAVVQYSSPNIVEWYGWTKQDFDGVPFWEVFHPDDRARMQEGVALLLKMDGIKTTMESRYLCKDGSFRDIEITGVNLLKDPNIQGILLTYHDITERKKQEAKLLYMGYHDPLTGLYNRAFFEEEMRRLDTQRQLPLSVICSDINGLKLINDVLGIAEGDKLIQKIAGILKKCCRKEDILARMGGGEFGILLPKMSMENTKRLVERLYNASEENKDENDLFKASISLGCATKTEEFDSIDGKLKLAAEHMNKRKLLERNSLHNSLLSSFKTTMIEKSQHTEEHAERMIRLSRKLGMEMKLTDEQLDELELLSTLHDIGKISIDESILNKKGKLTNEEWSQIKKHPEVGYRIAMSSSELTSIAEYIMCHHERWDGKGYPQGIAGEDIPLLSRIVAVTDAYDAMTNERPYRKALSKKEAARQIVTNAGTQFDPLVSELFVRIISRNKD